MIYHKNSVDLYPNAYPRHHCKQDKPFEIEGNKHTRARLYFENKTASDNNIN